MEWLLGLWVVGVLGVLEVWFLCGVLGVSLYLMVMFLGMFWWCYVLSVVCTSMYGGI